MKEFDPSRSPERKHPAIFYGWWMVVAYFLISMYIAGTVMFGFTAIIEPVVKELGWSYTQVSFAASLRGVESGLMAPLAGILSDRFGSKRVMFTGMAICGLGLLLLGQTQNLGMFYASFILISLGVIATAAPVTMPVIANWFHKKFGLAAGIVSSGVGLGGLMISLVVQLIDKYEWRMAMTLVGLGIFIIVLPLCLLTKQKPEKYGYLPDGKETADKVFDGNPASIQAANAQINSVEVLQSRTFIHIALAFLCGGFVVSTAITHVMPYLSSIGISRETAGLMAGFIPLASAVGRLGFGWITDKTNAKHATALCFIFLIIGFLFFNYIAQLGNWCMILSLILIGIGYGGSAIMILALTRHYFGTSKFGTIVGFIVGMTMLGQMGGPPLAGWIFDEWGSYTGAWFVAAALSLISLIFVMSTPPFRRETSESVN